MISVWRVLIPVALVAALAGCSYGSNAEDTASAGSQPARCQAAWKPGWQRLANRIDAPVYCPSWMPSPLDGLIDGQWSSGGPVVSRDRSYLIGFLWHEAGSGDIHVNFRGYPGQTSVPRCIDVQTSDGKTRRRSVHAADSRAAWRTSQGPTRGVSSMTSYGPAMPSRTSMPDVVRKSDCQFDWSWTMAPMMKPRENDQST